MASSTWLATEDLFSRPIVDFAMGEHPDAEPAEAALQGAVALGGGSTKLSQP